MVLVEMSVAKGSIHAIALLPRTNDSNSYAIVVLVLCVQIVAAP